MENKIIDYNRLKRLPPQATDIEEAILASCFLGQANQIVELLKPDDFYRTSHRKIFTVIKELVSEEIQIELPSVVSALRDSGDLEDIGGAGFVAGLTNNIPLASNVEHYAKIIRDKALLRVLIEQSETIIKVCHESPSDIKAVIDSAQQRIIGIKSPVESKIEIVNIESIATAEIEDKPVIEGLLGEKESLIVSAASGTGKSLLVTYLALALGNPQANGLWGLFQIPYERKTLIVQSENSLNPFNRRLNKLFNVCPEMRTGAKNVFTFKIGDDCRFVGSLTDNNFQKILVDSLLSIDASILILDPLISYHGEDENDNAAMRRSLDCLSLICDMANVSVILCHHYNRQNLTRGAASIRDWTSNMLLMDFEGIKDDSTILKITYDKSRNYEQQPDFYLERTPDLQFLRCEKPGKQSQQIDAVVTALIEMGGRVDSQSHLKNAVMVELNCSEATARRSIEQAMQMKKIIIKPGKGRKHSYELP